MATLTEHGQIEIDFQFQRDYDDTQDDSSLNNSSKVEFRVRTTYKVVETGEVKTKDVFIPMTTVYGGNEGVALYLKRNIMVSVYRWEDSAKQYYQWKY